VSAPVSGNSPDPDPLGDFDPVTGQPESGSQPLFGDDTIEVHVVVAASVPIRETAQLIHAAVATLVATPVHVYVEDVALV